MFGIIWKLVWDYVGIIWSILGLLGLCGLLFGLPGLFWMDSLSIEVFWIIWMCGSTVFSYTSALFSIRWAILLRYIQWNMCRSPSSPKIIEGLEDQSPQVPDDQCLVGSSMTPIAGEPSFVPRIVTKLVGMWSATMVIPSLKIEFLPPVIYGWGSQPWYLMNIEIAGDWPPVYGHLTGK